MKLIKPKRSLHIAFTAMLGLLSVSAGATTTDIEKNLSKLHLPPGFKIEIYAEVPGAREMALGQSTGTVFVGTRGEKVYAVVDKNKDRKADKVVTILDDLKLGNGVAVHQGNLYVAEQNRIARYAAPGFDLTLPFKQMREVIYDKLPDKGHHGWRYITFGPDNKLYVTIGSPCNICNPQGIEGTIVRMNADGSNAEVYAKGIRNSVGMDFQPGTGSLYFTDNNVDMMGDDNPSGELNAAPKSGMHFGFPFYAGGHARHPRWQDKQVPQKVTFPVTEFQAHTANLGFKFYTGSMFPADYKGDAIIAQHGSWNRSSPVGYRLVRVHFDANHKVKKTQVFIDGWLNNGEAWGRPTDVLQLPDGSLLVSDDYNGVLYRVSYGENKSKATTHSTQPKPAKHQKISGLAMPESVMTAANGNIYLSEIGGFGKQGDGKITMIKPDGSRHTLASGLNDPKGLDIWNNTLYVADVDRLLKITEDGQVKVLVKPADFPGKAVFLNDVEIDGKGTIYVSDSGDDNGGNAGIYRVSQQGEVSEILASHAGIKRPNGLLMDGPNQLLVVDFGNGNLSRFDINSHQLTLLNSGFGGADGLVRDSRGYVYISDWADGKVWRLTDPKATPQLIGDGYQASADIGLSADGDYLLVPDMKAGMVDYLQIR